MTLAISIDQHRTAVREETHLLTPPQLAVVQKLLTHQNTCRCYLALKSALDPLLAVLLMFLLLPLMLLIGLLVRCTSRGPVLYAQQRTGHMGKTFTLYKFRTMCEDAEKAGPQWSCRNDIRVTPLGRILRRTRLDELPQLINVLRGEMTFVGPRPERPEVYKLLRKHLPMFPLRTLVKPGITGWAQVYAGYAASITQSRTKLEYDTYYIENLSFLLDAQIVLKTIVVVFLGDHSVSEAPKTPVLIRSESAEPQTL